MSIASELQDKINSKAAIKAAIEAKGVTVGDVKLNQYAAKIDEIEQGGGDPSIPVGTGQHLVTFYDFDGKVLKRQRVATGGNATAPDTPIHQYLTFAEWNNPFTNVQSDIDTGAIYNTTDGKTYLFITLTAVTGLAPTLYFSKSSTSLMTIDWGDGTTSTSTTSGNQTIQHTYATAGDYIITVDNSAGGTWNGGYSSLPLFGNQTNNCILHKIYGGANLLLTSAYVFRGYSIKYISLYNKNYQFGSYCFYEATNLRHINIPRLNNLSANLFYNTKKLNKVVITSDITTIQANCFRQNFCIETIFQNVNTINDYSFSENLSTLIYIFLSATPPTLTNINAFTGINPICKIYVPDASVNAYKTATNWVTYANYIYPLSQKPQSDE